MKQSKALKSDLLVALLALLAAGICLGLSRFEVIPSFGKFVSIAEPGTVALPLDIQVTAIALSVFCVLLGIILNRLGGRGAVPFLFMVIVLVGAGGLFVERFSSIDLQVELFLCGAALSISFVQLQRLWEMDRRFTRRVIRRLTADRVDSAHVT
ncbi:MAG TPA: hypothetical protein VL866_07305, partial [Pyrinomonadaceae bacterium]|nr:hypothetical protein [Pyrinomonadaceae bacterium]